MPSVRYVPSDELLAVFSVTALVAGADGEGAGVLGGLVAGAFVAIGEGVGAGVAGGALVGAAAGALEEAADGA